MATETGTERSIRDRVEAIGPALVFSALLVGPGSIALSSQAGSSYGYRLLWIPVVATVFMVTYTYMAARIGLVTRSTFFDVVREKYGRMVAGAGDTFGFVTILAFQAGNSIGIGFAANALVGYDVRLWATVFTVVAAGFL